MELEIIETQFQLYLEKSSASRDIEPFARAYIGLLMLFKDEISSHALNVLQQRQNQLRGEKFDAHGFDDLRKSCRRMMDRDLSNNNSATREAMMNRMIHCALLDSEETHFFYLTEPMFEFVEKMEVSPHQLRQILESEFIGLKFN